MENNNTEEKKEEGMTVEPRKNALTLKGYHLRFFYELLGVPLHGEQARARNRFVDLFRVKAKEMEAVRLELIQKYGKLDENKKPIWNDTLKRFELADPQGFDKEYSEALDKEIYFDYTPATRKDFLSVKQFILSSKKELDIEETEMYEDICSAFEKI